MKRNQVETIVFGVGEIDNKHPLQVEYEVQKERDSRDTPGYMEVYINEVWYLGRNIVNRLSSNGLDKIERNIMQRI